MPPIPPEQFRFLVGEKVLCYHGPLIYFGKVVEAKMTGEWKANYFIRYSNTSTQKSWDEWVPESRMLKYNEANLQWKKEVFKQEFERLLKNRKAQNNKKKVPSTSAATSSSTATVKSAKKRKTTPMKGFLP